MQRSQEPVVGENGRHIPRPPNPFILFGSEMAKEWPKGGLQRSLSQVAGARWNNLPDSVKDD